MSKNRNYVIAEMQGNMGNWIFGYMYAYVWAKKYNIEKVYAKPEMPQYYKQLRYYKKLQDTVFRNINFRLNTSTDIPMYSPTHWYLMDDFSWIEKKNGIMFTGVVQNYDLYKDYRKDFIEIFGPNQDIKDDFYDVKIDIPKVSELLQPILTIVPLQLLAYEVAKLNKCDIDKPRNLAKSVTVE
jgi:hypothetical protein